MENSEKNINKNINKNERIDELGFDNLKIIQNKEYFCFGIDSVLLANFVKKKKDEEVLVDLCSGSGVIPIILSSKQNFKKIFAVELQNEMYDLLDRNILLNKKNNNIYPIHENILNVKKIFSEIYMNINKNNDITYIQEKSMLKKEKDNLVDVITVNPPYKIKGTGLTSNNVVKHIARNEEMCTLEDVLDISSKLLKNAGRLYMVHKPDRLVDIFYYARKYALEPKTLRLVHPKVNTKPSIALIEFIKNGKMELDILNPLYEFNEDGSYTDEILNIYGMNR